MPVAIMRQQDAEEVALLSSTNDQSSRFLGPLQKVPLYQVLWSFQQQLGALKRVGSRFPFRLVAFRRNPTLPTGVKMAEPRNRKTAQPFTLLDLAGEQDNFLAFGVAGFC